MENPVGNVAPHLFEAILVVERTCWKPPTSRRHNLKDDVFPNDQSLRRVFNGYGYLLAVQYGLHTWTHKCLHSASHSSAAKQISREENRQLSCWNRLLPMVIGYLVPITIHA